MMSPMNVFYDQGERKPAAVLLIALPLLLFDSGPRQVS